MLSVVMFSIIIGIAVVIVAKIVGWVVDPKPSAPAPTSTYSREMKRSAVRDALMQKRVMVEKIRNEGDEEQLKSNIKIMEIEAEIQRAQAEKTSESTPKNKGYALINKDKLKIAKNRK